MDPRVCVVGLYESMFLFCFRYSLGGRRRSSVSQDITRRMKKAAAHFDEKMNEESDENEWRTLFNTYQSFFLINEIPKFWRIFSFIVELVLLVQINKQTSITCQTL